MKNNRNENNDKDKINKAENKNIQYYKNKIKESNYNIYKLMNGLNDVIQNNNYIKKLIENNIPFNVHEVNKQYSNNKSNNNNIKLLSYQDNQDNNDKILDKFQNNPYKYEHSNNSNVYDLSPNNNSIIDPVNKISSEVNKEIPVILIENNNNSSENPENPEILNNKDLDLNKNNSKNKNKIKLLVKNKKSEDLNIKKEEEKNDKTKIKVLKNKKYKITNAKKNFINEKFSIIEKKLNKLNNFNKFNFTKNKVIHNKDKKFHTKNFNKEFDNDLIKANTSYNNNVNNDQKLIIRVKRSGMPLENNKHKVQKMEEISNITNNNPKDYYEAFTCEESEEWIKAISTELQNLKENNTMTIVSELPEGIKPLSPRWVFTKKYDGNNNLEKYKTRLVVKGYNQIEGVDYELTFSPTLPEKV